MNQQRATPAFANADQMARFYGGRSGFNSRRRHSRDARRLQVAKLLIDVDVHAIGWRAAMARELQISRWTLARDLEAIRSEANEQRQQRIDAENHRRREFAERLERSLDPDPRHEWRPIR